MTTPALFEPFVTLLSRPHRRLMPLPTRHHGVVGTRILTVEDDERIRTAVKLALEDEGWTVDEAGQR